MGLALRHVRFTTQEIVQATGGRVGNGTDVVGEDTVEVDGATQDSRALQPGQLFVPLLAERDGHDFIPAAIANGATAYLTQRPNVEVDGAAAIHVEDTAAALNDLARAARQRISGPVIGITGSVGKTSAKDLLAAAVRDTFATHWSAKSFNNEIGVPLTLINTPDEADVAIIEMGSRGIGHIETLCNVATPNVGIITTVAGAHTSEFGSLENIGVAKGELIESLPADGLAVLNGDNSYVLAMAPRSKAPVLTFGTETGNDVHIVSIDLDDDLRGTFVLDTEWGRVTVRPTTRGAHMATNVAAATTTALWLGVSIEAIEAGMAEAELSPWRMDVRRSKSGALIINDTYNANPTSMTGALDSLGRLTHENKIAVLGYMGELGDSEADDHRKIAETARSVGAQLIAIGTDLYGVDHLDDPADVLNAVGAIGSDTAILVKGSRSAGLETLAEQLLEK